MDCWVLVGMELRVSEENLFQTGVWVRAAGGRRSDGCKSVAIQQESLNI